MPSEKEAIPKEKGLGTRCGDTSGKWINRCPDRQTKSLWAAKCRRFLATYLSIRLAPCPFYLSPSSAPDRLRSLDQARLLSPGRRASSMRLCNASRKANEWLSAPHLFERDEQWWKGSRSSASSAPSRKSLRLKVRHLLT